MPPFKFFPSSGSGDVRTAEHAKDQPTLIPAVTGLAPPKKKNTASANSATEPKNASTASSVSTPKEDAPDPEEPASGSATPDSEEAEIFVSSAAPPTPGRPSISQAPSSLLYSDRAIFQRAERKGIITAAAGSATMSPTMQRSTISDEDLEALLSSTGNGDPPANLPAAPPAAPSFPMPIPPPPQQQRPPQPMPVPSPPEQQRPPQPSPIQPPQSQQQTPQQQVQSPPLDPFSGSGFLQRSDYEDPIVFFIMADPVSCKDGHTYDRPVIERCFDIRIKAEQERQLREAGEQGDQAQDENEDNAVCCGARAPIKLLSPVTNNEVDGVLVPNFILEQQIVRLMKVNAFQIEPEEIEDWEKRRREKKERDIKRAEEEKLERERIRQMEINARAFTRLREAEASVDPSQRVRLDPSVTTGLAVPLAGKDTHVPKEDITGLGLPLRCMVDRCAALLEEGDEAKYHVRSNYDWCARCARLVCRDCLGFEASDFASMGSGSCTTHQICVDCVTQLVDVMETSPDVSLKQRRVLLLRKLETHAARFSNRLATMQERVVRSQANTRYSPQLIEMEHRIHGLEQELTDLRRLAEEAASRAAAAQADGDPSEIHNHVETTATIERLLAECEEMERELAEIRESPPSDGDDIETVMKYFESTTALTDRLENAQSELAIAMSAADAEDAAAHVNNDKDDESRVLEQKVQQLTDRLNELMLNIAMSGGDDMDQALEISRVSGELEETQFQLVIAQSMTSTKPQVTPQVKVETPSKSPEEQHKTVSLQHVRMFAVAAENWVAERPRKKAGFFGRKKRVDDTEIVRDWLDSIVRLKTELPRTFSYDERIAKADELSALLPMASQYLGDGASEGLGLSAALHELEAFIADVQQRKERFLANAQQKKEQQHRKSPGSGSSDIFSDALADLLPVPVPGAGSGEDFESKTFGSATNIDLESKTVDSAATIDQLVSDLAAIGFQHNEWPLPHNLKFPTPRMIRQLEVLRNTLKLRKVESERVVEEEWSERFQRLTTHKEQLEDDKAKAQRDAVSAESNAKDEERRQRERSELRRKREEERLERERVLREQAEQAERERQELDEKHREAEAATLAAFSRVVGEDNGGAAAFGGTGDLRMCKRCKAGPIENQACSDLKSHNDTSTTYKGHEVFAKKNPNNCPNCGWFNADWQKWPYWDGIIGPH